MKLTPILKEDKAKVLQKIAYLKQQNMQLNAIIQNLGKEKKDSKHALTLVCDTEDCYAVIPLKFPKKNFTRIVNFINSEVEFIKLQKQLRHRDNEKYNRY